MLEEFLRKLTSLPAPRTTATATLAFVPASAAAAVVAVWASVSPRYTAVSGVTQIARCCYALSRCRC